MNKVSKSEAIALLWERSNLQWKLDSTQKDMCLTFSSSNEKIFTWMLARRSGKSRTLLAISLEHCLKKPNCVVKYLTPTIQMSRKIIRPLIRELIKDCPEELKPEEKIAEGVWRFPNGSEIQLAGGDKGNAERLRGGASDLCIVDEAGFCSDLSYIVSSILMPTTLTTGGKIIISSTPAKDPNHEFFHFVAMAKARGTFILKTVYDNPRIPARELERIIDATGGRDSIEFKREYLCEVARDDTNLIVPEFNPELKSKIVRTVPRPPFFDRYVSMDIGLRDLTAVLFGYYDFRGGKLVIEDEVTISGNQVTSDNLAKLIGDKESELWYLDEMREMPKIYQRVSDNNNLILLNDLNYQHNLFFKPTAKDDKAAAVNNMRIMVKSGNVIISPKCKVLIRHLESGTWNNKHTEFSRTEENGHFDTLDALVYLCRNLHTSHNPYPSGYHLDGMKDPFIKRKRDNTSDFVKELGKMVRIKKSINYE